MSLRYSRGSRELTWAHMRETNAHVLEIPPAPAPFNYSGEFAGIKHRQSQPNVPIFRQEITMYTSAQISAPDMIFRTVLNSGITCLGAEALVPGVGPFPPGFGYVLTQ